MKTKLPILFTAMVALSAHTSSSAADVSYEKVAWNHIPAHVVYANTTSNSVRITPALARRGAGSSESFNSMVSRLQPTAAITGTFFCTKSLQPTGDIVIEGKRVHSGCVGTGLCITGDGRVELKSLKDGRSTGWQDYQGVICGGPTLVRDGKFSLNPKSEGFKDPGLFGNRRRVAVGITGADKLIMVTVDRPISLGSLAWLMIHLGATDAIDLDGGSSTAMAYRGKIVSKPLRSLTNLLAVYETPELYAEHRSQLAPNMPRPIIATTPSKPSESIMTPNDPVLSALFAKPSKVATMSAPGWLHHEQFIDQRADLRVISSRPQ